MAAASNQIQVQLSMDRDCPTCSKKLTELNSGKILSCGHVICAPCLKTDILNLKENKCLLCGAEIDKDMLESFQDYIVPKPEATPGEQYICETDKPCTSVRRKHRYTKYNCEQHQIQITKICVRCCNIFCTECPIIENDCRRGARHRISSLEKTAETCLKELKDGIGLSDRNIDKLSKYYHEAVEIMESIRATTEENKKTIQKTKEMQIAVIAKQYKDMETALDNYVKTCEARMAHYLNDVDTEIRRLRAMKKSYQEYMEQTAAQDVVKNHSTKMFKVKFDLEMRCSHLWMTNNQRLTVEAGSHSQAEVQLSLVSPDPQLEFECTINTGDTSYNAVSFTQDDRLLAATDDGLQVWDCSNLTLEPKVIPTGRSRDVKTSSGAVYVLAEVGPDSHCVVKRVDLATAETSEMLHYKSLHTNIALYENHLFFWERGHDSWTINAAHLKSNNVKTYKLPCKVKVPAGLLVLSQDSLLVTDFKKGNVSSYQIKDGHQLEVEWEILVDGLNRPTGICKCGEDLIVVGSWIAPKLYIATADGQRLAELSHPELQNSGSNYRLSANEDRVALPCFDKGIKLFKLRWT